MYYLKYRPKKIAELDNSLVKDVVLKILESENPPHALMFFGQKGTGKTSTARIFAKAVNCLNRKDAEPCNRCKNCLAIEASSSPDVFELDAASNRGIEDIRNIIKESSFLPMTNRYRVYIIDEAHMITNDAFNALLKTLEEPPASVIFILATTNKEKVPKTILSRCVLVNFAQARKADIVSMLKKICRQEKLDIDDQLLHLISRHADHSFRDATKILEELVTQKKLTLEEGKKFLGLLQENFLANLQKRNLKESLAWINEFNRAGGNFKNLLEELLEELRENLLSNSGIKNDYYDGINLDTEDTVKLMKLLTEAYNNLKISPIESLPLEMAVVEFYNLKKVNS